MTTITSWLISAGLITWSELAIAHYQRIEGHLYLFPVNPTYEWWALDLPAYIGIGMFFAIPLILVAIVVRGRYPLRAWADLLAPVLLHVLAFTVLLCELCGADGVFWDP